MENLKSLLCASTGTIVLYIFDVILILAAIACAVVLYMKSNTSRSTKKEKNNEASNVEKIDDDTYVIDEAQEQPETQEEYVSPKSNRVEHFASQLAQIDGTNADELKSSTIVKNNEVEEPKKLINNQDLGNYVVVDGVKKEKSEQDKKRSINRGTGAYESATNFVNLIKDEQAEDETQNDAKKSSSKTKTTK